MNLLYTAPEGEAPPPNATTEDVKVDVVLKDESIWATQKAMAALFGCSPDSISLHLKNIYESAELSKEATTEYFSAVQSEGNRMESFPIEDALGHWSFAIFLASNLVTKFILVIFATN
ncbi:MAG: hypothetical protein J5737_07695 [Bacteroidales bacterium]|nr:hypothetical protein [Bacteroidales bacterium]